MIHSTTLMSVGKVLFTIILWGLLLSVTSNFTKFCGDVQVRFSAENGSSQEISCCMHSPSQCRWESASNPQANVTHREISSGLVLTWQPGRDPFGSYNCVNRTNGTEKMVIFLSEDEQESCQSCMSVTACTTTTEIKLVVTIWFDKSLIDTQCEIHRIDELPQVIEINRCITLLKEEFYFNVNYSVVCPICNGSQYNIHYSIPRSTLINASDCSIAGTCAAPSSSSSTVSSQPVSQMLRSTDRMVATSLPSPASFTSPSIMPTSSNQAEQNGTSGGDSKTGVIAGATVGAIAVAVVGLIIILLVICWYHRILCFKQKSVNQKDKHDDTEMDDIPSVSTNCTSDTTDELTVKQEVPPLNTEQVTSSPRESTPTNSSTYNHNEPPGEQVPLKVSTHDPENQSILEIITTLNPEMEQYIVVDELLPFLNRHKLLTRVDRERLGPQSTTPPTLKTRQLLSILDSIGPDGEENFVKALYESSSVPGHRHLIKLLQDNGVTIELTCST